MKQLVEPICHAYRVFIQKSRLRPEPTPLSNKTVFVPSYLRSCSHDAVRRRIQLVYDWPFLVFHRGKKTFISIDGKKDDAASIYRLKPVYSYSSEPLSPQLRPHASRPTALVLRPVTLNFPSLNSTTLNHRLLLDF